MTVTLKKHPPSGSIILERPDQCNAITGEMIERLRQAFSDFHQEPSVRAVIVTGAGPTFSAGLDLKELHRISKEPQAQERWEDHAQAFQELLETMLRFPKPIIGAVDGPAMGAGLAVLLACDLVVASHRSTFSVPSSRLGLVSGWALPLLQFRLGASTAARLALGGDILEIEEARNLGLVHHVVPSDQVWVRSHQWCQAMDQGSHESLQLSKRLLNEMIGEELLTWLRLGTAAAASSWTTEAAAEGLDAFTTGRKPNWPGRRG
jgi:methylglutaconyl-CoA hydratase